MVLLRLDAVTVCVARRQEVLADRKRVTTRSFLPIHPVDGDTGRNYSCVATNLAVPTGKSTTVTLNVHRECYWNEPSPSLSYDLRLGFRQRIDWPHEEGRLHVTLCFSPRSANSDLVHWAPLRPGGRPSHLHLPGSCQPPYNGLQVCVWNSVSLDRLGWVHDDYKLHYISQSVSHCCCRYFTLLNTNITIFLHPIVGPLCKMF